MRRLFRRDRLLPPVLGFTDGILNALTLASGELFDANGTVSIGLAARVSAAAFLTAAFTFFVAQYAEYRGELVTAARHLSLRSQSQLAQTQLGRNVIRDALVATTVASFASFPGALLPLAVGAVFPQERWFAALVALGLLALLGATVGYAIGGRAALWALAMVGGGILLGAAGVELDIA